MEIDDTGKICLWRTSCKDSRIRSLQELAQLALLFAKDVNRCLKCDTQDCC